MSGRVILPAKFAAEIKAYDQFDFSQQLASGETISSQVTLAVTYSGTDASPSSIIASAATVSGGVVTQVITGGVAGVIYELLCIITTSLSRGLLLQGYLAVLPNSS